MLLVQNMKLRKIQKRDNKLITVAFKKHQHVLFSAPTGYGKTVLLGKRVSKALARKETTLIIAPRIKLIQQFRKTLMQYGVKPFEMSIHQGRNTKRYRTAKIHIASTSTLNARLKRDKAYLGKIDNVIVDEVHINFKKLIMKQVEDLYWNSAKWLGVSATPIDGKGYRLEGYDHTLANTQTKDLVDLGYLLDLDVYIEEAPDLSNVSINSMGDYQLDELEGAMNSSSITTNIYKVWKKKFGNKKTMIFCVDIKHAESVAKHFSKHGVSVGINHSKLSDKDDLKVMQDFRDGALQVLVSVNKLTIGYDEPSVEVLIALRPTKSLSLMLQAVGRVLRLHESMNKAILIDCAGWYDEFGHPFDRRNFNKIKPEAKELVKKLKEDEEESKYTECFECGTEQLTSDLVINIDEDKEGITVSKHCIECNAFITEDYVTKKTVKKLIKVEYEKPVKRKKMRAFLEHVAKAMGYQQGWIYFKMKVYKDHKEKMSKIYRKYQNNEIVLNTVLANIRKLESE